LIGFLVCVDLCFDYGSCWMHQARVQWYLNPPDKLDLSFQWYIFAEVVMSSWFITKHQH